jgi:hypothetical protein
VNAALMSDVAAVSRFPPGSVARSGCGLLLGPGPASASCLREVHADIVYETHEFAFKWLYESGYDAAAAISNTDEQPVRMHAWQPASQWRTCMLMATPILSFYVMSRRSMYNL